MTASPVGRAVQHRPTTGFPGPHLPTVRAPDQGICYAPACFPGDSTGSRSHRRTAPGRVVPPGMWRRASKVPKPAPSPRTASIRGGSSGVGNRRTPPPLGPSPTSIRPLPEAGHRLPYHRTAGPWQLFIALEGRPPRSPTHSLLLPSHTLPLSRFTWDGLGAAAL